LPSSPVTVISLLLGYTTTVTAQAALALDPEATAPLTRVRVSWPRQRGARRGRLSDGGDCPPVAHVDPDPATPRRPFVWWSCPPACAVLAIGIDGFDCAPSPGRWRHEAPCRTSRDFDAVAVSRPRR